MDMTRRLIGAVLTAVLVLLTGFCTSATQALPRQRTWHADVRHAMRGSLAYIDHRAGHGRHLAVNLDIDNTALATRYAPGRPVRPVLRFARHARSHGVRMLINTGRRVGAGRLVRARHQLRAAGYRITEICGRHAGETVVHSKQRCRRQFVAQGYTLIANVGNRSTDFVGGNYERAFRLPNFHNQLG